MGLFSWLSREVEAGRIEAQSKAQQQRDYEAAKQRNIEQAAERYDYHAEMADECRAKGLHELADSHDRKARIFDMRKQ
jgi:hypothetical protein